MSPSTASHDYLTSGRRKSNDRIALGDLCNMPPLEHSYTPTTVVAVPHLPPAGYIEDSTASKYIKLEGVLYIPITDKDTAPSLFKSGVPHRHDIALGVL